MVKTNPVDGPYVADEDVTLTAEEKEGYLFAGWDANSGCPDLESPSCTITLPGADRLPVKTVTATFAPSTTLTTRTWIEGARTSGGGGAISPASDAHPQGRAVNLTARAAPTHLFSRWEVVGGAGACDRGSVSTGPGRVSATCTVTLTADTTVIAYFVGAYGLTVPSSDLGSIKCTVGGTTTNCEGATTNYASGTKVWLRAKPDNTDTHEFSHWTVSTSGSGASGSVDTEYTKNPLDVTMDAATTVTATFRAKPTPTPTATATPTPTYKLTATAGSGGSIECRTGSVSGTIVSCTGTFDEDTVIKIIPTVSGTHTFGSWTGCDSISSANVCTVTMTAAKTVTASFTARSTPTPTYKLDARAGSGGSVRCRTGGISGTIVSCTGTFDEDTVVTITASVSNTHTFGSWTGCDSISSANVCTVTMNAAKAVRAAFTAKPPPTGGTYRAWSTTTPPLWRWTASCNIGTGSSSGSGFASRSAAASAASAWVASCPLGGGGSSTSRVTTYGWTASCRIGSTSSSGSGYASRSAAASAASAWIATNCPTGGGTSDTSMTTTYGWTASCNIGTRRGSRSGYASRSAAANAASAWITANCPSAGTSNTSPTTRWYATVTCINGTKIEAPPQTTLALVIAAAQFIINTQCPATSSVPSDVNPNQGRGGFTTRSVKTWSWSARCRSGGRSGSGSGYTTESAALSAARTWIAGTCPAGGGSSTPTSATTHGWTASCRSGTGRGSGSGHTTEPAAAAAARRWIAANCPAGGGMSSPTSDTTYNWAARCRRGGGRDSGSGFTSRPAAAAAGQAWVDANCPAGGGTSGTSSYSVTTWHWSASCNSGSRSSSGSGLASEPAAESAAQAWINTNCG